MRARAEPITDEVLQVGGYGLTSADDAAIYLVRFKHGAALIDAGTGRAIGRLLANVEAAGVAGDRLTALLLTHCHYDHSGGARELRERLGCRVVIHELDAPFLEGGDDEVTAASLYDAHQPRCPVDRRLREPEESILVGDRPITAIHIPGHSPGSVAYVARSSGRTVVFAQDVHGPLHSSLRSDPQAYQRSLRTLLALRADILCEGHYGVFRGEAVADFLRSFMR